MFQGSQMFGHLRYNSITGEQNRGVYELRNNFFGKIINLIPLSHWTESSISTGILALFFLVPSIGAQ